MDQILVAFHGGWNRLIKRQGETGNDAEGSTKTSQMKSIAISRDSLIRLEELIINHKQLIPPNAKENR
ncbi:hypothetical protein TNCV_1296551 [Trichonephila clavipes]|uniref:Uncharacterized protein n=1 Tax=Trichonephila clavipes TaxID=2585209 RepID=A0A8X6SHV5_TRICX|nr:hypothetical protein TNCV_1296551 [Trichonephila clavipes]